MTEEFIGYSEKDFGKAYKWSPAFIDFLMHWLEPSSYRTRWFDQLQEGLSDDAGEMVRQADVHFRRLLGDARAVEVLRSAMLWFHCLLLGDIRRLRQFQDRFKFIVILGVPRTGGSYITAETFTALGYDKESVHPAIAHDGFPDGRPFSIGPTDNPWIASLSSMAQYLAAVEVFFRNRGDGGAAYVPKKATKAIYVPELYAAVLGDETEYFVTLRHPIASCISMYEKSGGMPTGGGFKIRSAMERWVGYDNLMLDRSITKTGLDYFEAYARYWEHYHIRLATSGIFRWKNVEVIPYGQERMETLASEVHRRFGSSRNIERFKCRGGSLDKHPEWVERGSLAISRVASIWGDLGLRFPAAELEGCL